MRKVFLLAYGGLFYLLVWLFPALLPAYVRYSLKKLEKQAIKQPEILESSG